MYIHVLIFSVCVIYNCFLMLEGLVRASRSVVVLLLLLFGESVFRPPGEFFSALLSQMKCYKYCMYI